MNKYLQFIILILAYFLLTTISSLAQQNIINVPTADITEKRHLFFQEQINIGNRNIQSSTIFTWGWFKNFQGGFNIRQLTFNTRPHSRIIGLEGNEPENNPELLINLQKGFDCNEWLKLGIGTKAGMNIVRHSEDVRFLNFSYFNTQIAVPETENILVLGSYYANPAFAIEGTNWGFMAGLQVELIKDKFSFITDYISGSSSLSVMNFGLQASLPKQWQIALAAQLPSLGSDNHHAAVIQLSRK